MDGTRSALIVASDNYHDPGLRRLRAPASDARALAGVLEDPGIGGFEVRTLLNEPAHLINLAVEEFFADRRPGDLLLVHFSGHGVKDEDGELYFAASNTVLGRLGATAVAAEFVSRRMNRSRSRRVVLLLDCCYAGAFERGLTARAGTDMGIEQQFGGRGRAVITASSAMEYAFEAGELADSAAVPPSVFTNALVEGLQSGDADRDQDGQVGLDELYDYVYDKVRAVTPNQTPGKWTFGMEGELYIARRGRPVTGPAPLPAELQQAIGSPLALVRAGAVQELAGILRGGHPGQALAARLALDRLTGDDSRAVAAAAATALGIQLPPTPTLPAASIDQPAPDTLPGARPPQGPLLAASFTAADAAPPAAETRPAPANWAPAKPPPAKPSPAKRRSWPGRFGPVKWAIAAAVALAAAGTALAIGLTGHTSPAVTLPVVSGVSPAHGTTAGGVPVTITGTGLAGATGVSFGTAAATITSDTDTQIAVDTPPSTATGTVSITVTTAAGTSKSVAADQYTYTAQVKNGNGSGSGNGSGNGAPTVTGVSTTSGTTAGGTPVTLTGTNLDNATVSFGGTAATITSDTATQITVNTPPGTGTVTVTVTTQYGTDTSQQFTYRTFLQTAPAGIQDSA